MSLIHDALKKAQDKEAAPLGSGLASFQDAATPPPKEGMNKRTLVLAAVLTLAVGFFVYSRLVPPKEETSAPPVPAAAIQPQNFGDQDAARLKKGGVEAYNADDIDRAWSSLQAANKLDEKDPETWNNMGLVARKRGDLLKARECYEKAIELKPEYPEAMNNLAVLSLQGGDIAKARELLEKAVALSPAYPEANFHLAILYEQKGDKAKAIEYYKRFLEVSGSLPSNIVDQVRDHVVEIEK